MHEKTNALAKQREVSGRALAFDDYRFNILYVYIIYYYVIFVKLLIPVLALTAQAFFFSKAFGFPKGIKTIKEEQ